MATAHTLDHGDEAYDAHVLQLDRAVYVWLGRGGGGAREFGALCAAVPPLAGAATAGAAAAAQPACSNLLGDSAPLEDVAGRLSRRLGKLVLLASALGSAGGSGALVTGDTAWLEAALLAVLQGRQGGREGGAPAQPAVR